GTYHYSGQPATTWQGFAKTIFKQAKEIGLIEKFPVVEAITTAEYPTPAIRPLNTIFDCQNIERELGIFQPDWHEGLNKVLQTWKAV
ncbi:MAG: sugar nucleotide-binding protein, partial [Gammaproteobacteria bacterium]|nr:sugar nucleotide-binding protein [Gammaproteobacteria bacterium]